MAFKKWINVYLVAYITLVTANQQCPTILQTIDDSTIEWKSYKDSVVTSKPRCLNYFNKYLLQICENGRWNISKTKWPQCDKFSTDDTCADSLLPLENYCALVTLPQKFDDKCPTGFLKYYNFARFDPSFEYWSSTRKVDNVFIHTAADSMYGKEFIAPNQKTDCFIVKNNTAMPKFCNESYHQICVIPKYFNTDNTLRYLEYSDNNEENMEVKLKFDRKRGKILLNIYNPKLSQKLDDINEEAIYCFTNADDKELKTPLKIERVISKATFKVYKISLKHEHPGEYWCDVFDNEQNVHRTNVLIAYKKKKGHEYSLRVILKGMCINTNVGLSTTSLSPFTVSVAASVFQYTELQNKENCTILDGKTILNYLSSIKFKNYFYNVQMAVRVMKIIGKTENPENVDVILHLTTLKHTNIVGDYYKQFRFLHSIPDIDVLWFRSADFCLPVTSFDTTSNITLEWKLTAITEDKCANKWCLNQKSIPYRRKCMGDFITGAFWDEFDEVCYENIEMTDTTKELFNISQNVDLNQNVLDQIQNLTTDFNQITTLDVFLIANIMNSAQEPILDGDTVEESDNQRNITSKTVVVNHLIETVDHIMNVDKSVLKESQLELNATDTLLDSIEKYLGDDSAISKLDIYTKLNAGEVFLSVKPKFVLHICKPFLSNVHGVGLYHNDNVDNPHNSFLGSTITSIELNQTFDDLDLEGLELATYVPIELLELIKEENNNLDNITIITSVFFNDNLFNSDFDDLGKPHSKIISVKIPEFGLYLDEPLPILFRSKFINNNDEHNQENLDVDQGYDDTDYTLEMNATCAYWQYGEDASATNKTGHWSKFGGSLTSVNSTTDLETSQSLTTCHFNHLTHFALLIMNQRLIVSEPEDTAWFDIQDNLENHNNFLSIITYTGCVLSFLGILGIILTAVCFSRWRQKTGSKILVQLSLAIMLELIVVQVAGVEKLTNKTQLCTIIGICLHYVVLAKSSWMFVSAILQYLRFVKIFQVLPNRLIMKAMFFSWGLPLVPVCLVAVLLPDYNASERRFCYPVDLGLYLGLFVPVALIVFSNLIVFILIMKNIYNPNIEMKPRTSYKNATSQNKLQIYLGILLFFMLGVPWVFGILAEILTNPLRLVCTYLFCLTATLQGCVLFLFYIVLDRDTRRLWLGVFQFDKK